MNEEIFTNHWGSGINPAGRIDNVPRHTTRFVTPTFWEVVKEGKVVFSGTKKQCDNYITNL